MQDERLLDRSMIARLLGLLSSDRFASEMSAVTRVIVILYQHQSHTNTSWRNSRYLLNEHCHPQLDWVLAISSTYCVQKRDRQYSGRNFDKFRQFFINFGTNHLDNPCDWKIVKCPINTCTTLSNDDVIVTSLKNAVFARRETPEFILPLLRPPNMTDLNPVDKRVSGITARQGVQNMHDWSRRPEALHKNLSGLSSITPSLQLLCISDVVVSKGASRPAAVISSTVFDLRRFLLSLISRTLACN